MGETTRPALADMTAPDTPLIAAAIEHARSCYEPYLFNHVIRSWLFAVKIARIRQMVVDEEVVAVAALLHDLGLTEAFQGSNRFEVEGADATRAFAKGHGVDDRRAQLIWDGVALHSTPSIAQHKEAEVALCAAGIAMDFGGAGVETLAPDELAVVLDAFPRLDMKRKMKTCFCHLAHAKPATTYESFVRDFGERFVAGYKAPSRVDFLMNAPFRE
jgi:HD superfamily phosphodiesterase